MVPQGQMHTSLPDIEQLRPAGGKRSSKRDLILNVFLRQEGHLSADDLVDIIRRDATASSALRVPAALSDPVSKVTGIPRHIEQGAQGDPVLPREEVGGSEQGALAAMERGEGEGVGRHGRLARPDVALQEAEHRFGPGEVLADDGHRRRLVPGQLDGPAHLPNERRSDRLTDRPISLIRRRDRDRPAPPALAAAADHAHLDRQQLIERQPAERAIPRLERCREVGLLDRLADPRQLDPLADVGGEVLRIAASAAVERLADGGPEPGHVEAGGEPVDGHDAAGVEQGAPVVDLGSPGPRMRTPCDARMRPLITTSWPAASRRSMYRRPNQTAWAIPVPSRRIAVVRWTRRRNVGAISMETTFARALATSPSGTPHWSSPSLCSSRRSS